MSRDGELEIPDRALQSALEFAVLLAAAGQKTRPALAFPAGLKPFLKFHKLPPKALSTVREVVEADAEYLRKLGIGAQAELVDEVGMLWLQRPDGWQERIVGLVQPVDEIDDVQDARAERRRREAAEAGAARSRLEIVELADALTKAQSARPRRSPIATASPRTSLPLAHGSRNSKPGRASAPRASEPTTPAPAQPPANWPTCRRAWSRRRRRVMRPSPRGPTSPMRWTANA